ncbi:Galactose-1-phosphate uridylyltransferase [compost metagenome]
MHHIKKENIGLIEVMGLAILPGRLKEELSKIADILSGNVDVYDAVISGKDNSLAVHVPWIKQLVEEFGTTLTKEEAHKHLQQKVGVIFAEILGHAGVFKLNTTGRDAFKHFVSAVGYCEQS